jgi:hypothetical protein
MGGRAQTGGAGRAGGGPVIGDGYVVTGTWHGYAWTAAVTSTATGAGTSFILPPDFSGVAGSELCVQGSVGPASDYGGVALLGVNVNQGQIADDAGNNPQGTVAIGGSGVTVKYSNAGGSVLRVQIQTPYGGTDPTGRWCATLSGAGGTQTVTWDQFWGGAPDLTQGCWNSGGNHPPVGTAIQNVALVVPGGNVYAVPFQFCLQGLAQAG